MIKKSIFIGRNEDNDIVVPAVFGVVSGNHADLKLLDTGEYLFSDHSTNGSTVKGKYIRNEAVTISFGTPVILATRYALDWERVRELLPPVAVPKPSRTVPIGEIPDSEPTQLRTSGSSHPSDFTPIRGNGPQPAYDRSSHIEQPAPRTSGDSRETRMSGDPRETRTSGDATGAQRATGGLSGSDAQYRGLEFKAGALFDGRFLLVRNIGQGASSTVWEAQDTKAGGMKVAIKIFSLKHGMDSYGFQNLQREFTTVFNFTQQYLLTPSFYDVCEGRPYLVMRYCERGSATKLIGRASEDQVIKMLHDVASGLEYLHQKKIIHQDIKPDNILIADNGDFMITDFGISATIDALNGATDMSGGTRAYMGPERFNGQNVSGSDIWSLGATAYELVTGDAPYGDHGGIMQSYGTAVPPIAQKLQPEVKDIIMGCLERDPSKRSTAAEIRKKIDVYYETGGSWRRKNKAKTVLLIAAAATALLLIGAGIWIWDYNRVKSYYYGAVTEVYGVPQGVGKEVNHSKRAETFLIQKQRGKVIRLANVNGAGKVVPFSDTEYRLRYFPETRYEYTSNGQLDDKLIYNEHGRPLFRMDMNIDKEKRKGTAAFFRFDDDNTEMLLPLGINQNFKDDDFYIKYSTISKYGYAFDEDGYVKEVRYLGFGSLPTTDQYGIGGIKYKYDDRGLITQQQYIDTQGKPTFDSNGLSIRQYDYDDNANCTELRLLSIDKGPSHIGNHCPVIRYEYDKNGNRLSESYFDMKGKPMVRTDGGMHSFAMEYDGKGNVVARKFYDKKGKLVENKYGVAIEKSEFNGDGFATEVSCFDAKEKPVISHGTGCSIIKVVPGPTGLYLETRLYNEKGEPMEDSDGAFLTKYEYDDYGNNLSASYFDKKERPIDINGLYHRQEREYNQNSDCVSVIFLDKKGNPATVDGVIYNYRMKYNPWGAVSEICYYDPHGKLTRDANLVAGTRYEYDPKTGKQNKVEYLDRDGKSLTLYTGSDVKHASNVDRYKDGNLVESIYYDVEGKPVRRIVLKYDRRGNFTQRYFETNGKLDGAVENYKYDDNNNQVEVWYTTLANQPTKCSQGYHKAKYKYDEMGNLIESTFWSADGRRAVDLDGIHKNTYVYDRFGQITETRVADASGHSVKGVSSHQSQYDDFGNEVEQSWHNASGRLAVPSGFAWARVKKTYDKHGRNIKLEYFDAKGNPVEVDGATKYEASYDARGNIVKQKQYNRNGLHRIEVNKYNPQGKNTEYYVTDADNRLTDDGKLVIEYEIDGVTPKVIKLYDISNTLSASMPWDDKTKEWDSAKIKFY